MISHNHKCVFVHIPKCGGQSIESIFIESSGLTWETRAPLLLRPNEDSRVGPPSLAHLTYHEYIKYRYMSPELMSAYLTFALVREPYARVESLYRFLGFDCAIPFERFVCKELVQQIHKKGDLYYFVRPQHEFVCDAYGAILVDEVVKLEESAERIPALLMKTGIYVDSIPHRNKSVTRSLLRSARQRLHHAVRGTFSSSFLFRNNIEWKRESIEAVNRIYEKDFCLFGYKKIE